MGGLNPPPWKRCVLEAVGIKVREGAELPPPVKRRDRGGRGGGIPPVEKMRFRGCGIRVRGGAESSPPPREEKGF